MRANRGNESTLDEDFHSALRPKISERLSTLFSKPYGLCKTMLLFATDVIDSKVQVTLHRCAIYQENALMRVVNVVLAATTTLQILNEVSKGFCVTVNTWFCCNLLTRMLHINLLTFSVLTTGGSLSVSWHTNLRGREYKKSYNRMTHRHSTQHLNVCRQV